MAHTDKSADTGGSRTGRGVGGCGGNMLQHNLSSGAGLRGVADIVREQIMSARSAAKAYTAIRRHDQVAR
jgi:hypothetical protein